jgi:hypothetical protein
LDFHRLLTGLLLRILSGLLLLLSGLHLPFSVDISKVLGYPSYLAEVISQLQPISFLTFESENKCIHI